MAPALADLLGRRLLWHGTRHPETADSIERHGLRLPSGLPREQHRGHAIWCYQHSDPGVNEWPHRFLLAVDFEGLERGRDYTHEGQAVVLLHVPLPVQSLVARLDFREVGGGRDLAGLLDAAFACDAGQGLEGLVCRDDLPWRLRVHLAELLATIEPEGFVDRGGLRSLLLGELPELKSADADALVGAARKSAAFCERLLACYYRVFLTPRLGRAAMLAAVPFLGPRRVLELADSGGVGVVDPVERFTAGVLAAMPVAERVRGALEMVAMRRFPGTQQDVEAISSWVRGRAKDSVEVALHQIRYGRCFPARQYPDRATDLSVDVLRVAESDPFVLIEPMLTDDDPLNMESVHRAVGTLRDPRAVPALRQRLDDDRKAVRASAVRALGRIGGKDALNAIRTVESDRRKVVQRAVKQALSA